MPRAKVDPIVKVMEFFETAPLATVEVALVIIEETVRRRKAGEAVLTVDGPRIDPPGGARRRSAAKPRKTRAADETPIQMP